jgi:hypothetical protein
VFAEVHVMASKLGKAISMNLMELHSNDWPFEKNSDPNIDDGEIF